MTSRSIKPVIEVHLMPDWTEEELRSAFDKIVEAATRVKALRTETESDIIVLFPKDAMEKGLGTEIVVRVLVPQEWIGDEWAGLFGAHISEIQRVDEIAAIIGKTVSSIVPKAHVQCSVIPFPTLAAYWSTE